MQNNMEFCVYGEFNDEVRGVEEIPANSFPSDKKSEENDVTNAADINNEITVVDQPDEQPDSDYMNICYEDAEENIIKKVSVMSLAEVQQDIDETYEYGKADLYNEVLKGYTVIKCTLEELGWECHSLEDIQEEEEPETDSDEIDLNENVLKNINLKEDLNQNYSPDVQEESNFAAESLGKESSIATSEEALFENYQIMMEGNETSMDSAMAEENSKRDPVLEPPICDEKQYPGSMNANEEDCPSEDLPVSEENDKMISVPDFCLSKEENGSGSVSIIEEVYPNVDSPIMEENCTRNSAQDLCLSKKEMDSVCLGNIEETHGNVSSEDRGEERLHSAPDILPPAASQTKQRKKRFSSLRKFFARICCCVKKPSK